MMTKEEFLQEVRLWANVEYLPKLGQKDYVNDMRSFDPVLAQMFEAQEATRKKLLFEIRDYAKNKTEGR